MSPAEGRAAQARRAHDAAALFSALGDATRLQLLMRLSASGPGSIAQMSAGERRGREHIWRLRPQGLRDVHAQLDRISKQWDDALERLRAFVEEDDAHG
jgi:hypothetical protein